MSFRVRQPGDVLWVLLRTPKVWWHHFTVTGQDQYGFVYGTLLCVASSPGRTYVLQKSCTKWVDHHPFFDVCCPNCRHRLPPLSR